MQGVAIRFLDMLGFLIEIKRIGRLHLHPIGQFKCLNPGFEFRFFAPRSLVLTIDPLQQVELPPLVPASHHMIGDILDQLFHFGFAGIKMCPLKNSWEKGRAPIRNIGDGEPRAHRDEAGKIGVFRPQSIIDPGPETRP